MWLKSHIPLRFSQQHHIQILYFYPSFTLQSKSRKEWWGTGRLLMEGVLYIYIGNMFEACAKVSNIVPINLSNELDILLRMYTSISMKHTSNALNYITNHINGHWLGILTASKSTLGIPSKILFFLFFSFFLFSFAFSEALAEHKAETCAVSNHVLHTTQWGCIKSVMDTRFRFQQTGCTRRKIEKNSKKKEENLLVWYGLVSEGWSDSGIFQCPKPMTA